MMKKVPGTILVEACDVEKTYRVGAVTLPVLRGVNLRCEPGGFLAVTGPSGSGKSTLLHLLAGLDTPTAGEVRWEGQPIAWLSDAQRSRWRHRMIGIVFQFYHLVPELTALENVMLAGLVNGRADRKAVRAQATECLEAVRLGARVAHRPRQLSGGEQQRVAIARALVNRPAVLLCDEPTGNLDSATGGAAIELLCQLQERQRVSLVLATHDPALAKLAGRQVILRDGRIVDEAS